MSNLKARLTGAYRFWQRNLDVFRSHYLSSIVGNIGEPLLYLFGLGAGIGGMINEVDGVPYLQWIAPGMMVSAAMNAAAFECTFGAFTRMTEQKVYDGVLATPLEVEDIVLGEILWGAAKGLMSSAILLLVLTMLGLFDQWRAVPFLLIEMALFGVVFAALTMCVTAVAGSYESFNYFLTLFLTPMMVFSGIWFPASRLPAWLTHVVLIFPTPHAVTVARYLFYGGGVVMPIIGILFLAASAPPLIWCAMRLVKRRLIPAPGKGA